VKKLSIGLLPTLEEKYGRYWWTEDEEQVFKDVFNQPFKNLIFTILSQNTSGENTRRAYLSLASRFLVEPYTLAEAEENEISEAIRPGGLHKVKARRIKEGSRYVVEKFGGDLSTVLSFPKEEARKVLKQIPGVGDKTADVLLSSIHGYREMLVVDTHMSRIAKRLGLVNDNAKCEDIQKSLKEFIPWNEIPQESWERIVGLFWLLAKHTCKAQRPKCGECLLTDICEKGIVSRLSEG